MKDMNDKEIKLSQFAGKGNYVFVDFWASWCGPCRAEMPNVVEAYNKYHSKGLEIVGVSFDQKKDAWTAMVKKLGMEWPQMSDLKGWQCEAGKGLWHSFYSFKYLVRPTRQDCSKRFTWRRVNRKS